MPGPSSQNADRSAVDGAHVLATPGPTVATPRRRAPRWGYFVALNVVAICGAAALFLAVLYADGLDVYLGGAYRWLLAHPGVTSVAALSPLFCSLLVGAGYARRARRRREWAARRGLGGRAGDPSSAGAAPGA